MATLTKGKNRRGELSRLANRKPLGRKGRWAKWVVGQQRQLALGLKRASTGNGKGEEDSLLE